MQNRAKGLYRPGPAFAALFVALPLVIALAPAAYAGGITDVTDAANDTVDDATQAVGDTVDSAADPDGPIQETIDDTTDAVDNATGGATEPVTDPVRKITQDNLGPVDDVVGGVTDDVLGSRDPAIDGGRTGGSLDGAKEPSTSIRQNAPGTAGRASGATGGTTISRRVTQPVSRPIESEVAGPPSIVEQAGRIAREVAFPLALLLMVGGFLVIQSRWDKKDPKLALAPIDVDDQYLSFR